MLHAPLATLEGLLQGRSIGSLHKLLALALIVCGIVIYAFGS